MVASRHDEIFASLKSSSVAIVAVGDDSEVLSVYCDSTLVRRAFNLDKSLSCWDWVTYDITGYNHIPSPPEQDLSVTQFYSSFYTKLFTPSLYQPTDTLYTDTAFIGVYKSIVDIWSKMCIETALEKRAFTSGLIEYVGNRLVDEYMLQSIYMEALPNDRR